ncbi:alpha/beta fold hydrolase [Xylanimonas oleitrophica]|uniref:alpha/beta fold hydrolase n=1 Tax=Xylanimonas oleitrophica TaxID=2607479 RepID=UPI0015D0637F|nr:alpha/beta fold hydrolase [Xylanimonas oleitrophica]
MTKTTPARMVAALAATVLLTGAVPVLAPADVITGASAAAATPPPTTSTRAPSMVPAPDWFPCPEAPAYECATVRVPTDHDRPHGPHTAVAVTRLPATDPAQREGSLLVNFGGPGGEGVSTLHATGEHLFEPEVRERFDLVSFDPRGVGLSDPATCFRTPDDEAAFLARTVALPTDQRQAGRMVAEAAVLGASCTLYSHDRLASASSANVARDMDLLRQALGDEQLTYVGYSYGTILGATYAALYPDRVRAMVLDGPLDPRAWSGVGSREVIGVRLGQAEGFERTSGEFARLCAEAGPRGCPLAGLGDPATVLEDLLAALREGPVELPAGDGSTVEVGYAEVLSVVFQSMYSSAAWTDLSALLAVLAVEAGVVPQAPRTLAAPRGAGELLRRLLGAEDYAGSVGSSLATLCADDAADVSVADYRRQAAALEAAHPHWGTLRGWTGVHCEFVHARDDDAYTGPWEQQVEAPVLVVGTTYDPATVYEHAAPYAGLWPDARLLTLEGWGHTVPSVGSSCADAAVARYLVALEADDGAVCAQDTAPFGDAPATSRTAPAPHPGAVPWTPGL